MLTPTLRRTGMRMGDQRTKTTVVFSAHALYTVEGPVHNMAHLMKQGVIIAMLIPRALKAGSVESNIGPPRHSAMCSSAAASLRSIAHCNRRHYLEMVRPQTLQGVRERFHLRLIGPIDLNGHTAYIYIHPLSPFALTTKQDMGGYGI
jgi:hypothetical protein